MAAARRKSKARKPRRTIALSRKQLGIICIVLGALYFFAVFMAQESPMLAMANKVFAVILGAQGLHVFFIILILMGVGLLARAEMVGTTLKQ